MATIKAYTDINQSKILDKILSSKGADMFFKRVSEHIYDLAFCEVSYSEWAKDYKELYDKAGIQVIPCWSLAALLACLPDELEDNHFLTLNKEGNEYCCCYEDVNGNSFRHTFEGNPVDACYEMLTKLKELNLL